MAESSSRINAALYAISVAPFISELNSVSISIGDKL